jgi:hypothetical protein
VIPLAFFVNIVYNIFNVSIWKLKFPAKPCLQADVYGRNNSSQTGYSGGKSQDMICAAVWPDGKCQGGIYGKKNAEGNEFI